MYNHQKTGTALMFTCFAISLLALSSGCRSGGFSKPDLSKLAFWKSENLMFKGKDKDAPPPPARHFDPTPIDKEKESQVVDLDQEKLQRKFNNDIEEMRAEISAAAKSLESPIRKPYSAEALQNQNEFVADTKSSFEAATGNVRSKLDGFGTQAKAELSAAQNDFQAAMQNTSDSFDSKITATRKSASDMTQGWKDNIAIPGLTTANNLGTKAVAAVNQSLSEVNDRLSSNLEPATSDSFKSGISEFGGSLKPMKNATMEPMNQFSANAQERALQIAQNLNGFSPAPGSSAQQASPELERVQAEMLEAKRQIEELKQQIAMTGKAGSGSPQNQPAANRDAFGPSIPTAGEPSFAGNQPTNVSAPAERVAQRETPGFGSQYAASASMFAPPTNQLRSSQPLRPEFPAQVAPSTDPTPNYPSTSLGGFQPRNDDFSGNFSPTQMTSPANQEQTFGSAPVDFQSATGDSRVVTANNAIPANASDSATKIQSHVFEVDVPESILTGAGSYAPGSVQSLQSDK